MPRIWTAEELQLLKDLFPNTEMYLMEKAIGRKDHGIYKKAKDLGLKRSMAFRKMIKEKTNINLILGGKSTRFEKGNVSKNKGKKREEWLSAEAIEKVKKTQFKKGSIPHNHKPLGSQRITVDGYIEIKVNDFHGNKSKKNYQLKHRILWEEVNGVIPPKTKVSFKKGASKTDFTIEDLFLESHADNLIRNSMSDSSIVKRFLGMKEPTEVEFVKENAPGLIKLKRNQIKLNTKIKESCNNN